MLSYQHIYHAGCLADVHKHAALCALLDIMVQKDKPLTYIETHAGRGLYDLTAPEAQKTGEAAHGILRAKTEKWFPENHPYTSSLTKIKQSKGESVYPGSAYLAANILRPEDKMHLMELHPQEYYHLRTAMHGTGATLYQKDGYENLLSISPPTPRRGLVFIDPSFEIKSEYQSLPKTVQSVMKKWPVAVLCIWYPLLRAQAHIDMVKQLQSLQFEKSNVYEIDLVKPGVPVKGLYGSGLFIANMPYGADEAVNNVHDILRKNI